MSLDEFLEEIRNNLLPRSFSKHHKTLLRIVFGHIQPQERVFADAAVNDQSNTYYYSTSGRHYHPNSNINLIPLNEYSLHLDRMIHMVQLEFAESMTACLRGSGSSSQRDSSLDPHPYDVFVMKPTLQAYKVQHKMRNKNGSSQQQQQQSTQTPTSLTLDGQNLMIAVCLPTRGPRMLWYTGQNTLLPLDRLVPKFRIASLSGPARVLQVLEMAQSAPPDSLTAAAMRRDQEWLIEAAYGKELLVLENFERAEDGDEGEESIKNLLKKMNASQRRAVATMLCPRFDQGFLLIQGPPGTGKSTTIVSMILVSLANGYDKKILVTAPSNAAVANLALKLFETGRFSHQDITIFGENCDPKVHFLSPKHRGEAFQVMLERMEGFAKNDHTNRDKLRHQFVKWMHLHSHDGKNATQDISIDELSALCPYHPFSSSGATRLRRSALTKAQVILCTLNTAGTGLLQTSLSNAVSTIMLDEAAQTPEVDFYIITNFPGVKRIVVVGDPQQLPSTVISQACAQMGFGESWMKKVQALHPNAVHLLDTQYRMDPLILAFPNKAFYDNRISTGENVLSRDEIIQKPFAFVDTSKQGFEEMDHFKSYCNLYEAEVIKTLLTSDSDILNVLENSSNQAKIIIISPYRSQVKVLHEMLEPLMARLNIEIATVDSFQGQEGDIVILSTVRTKGVGFAGNRQRLNVALTRAKRVLRVVGDFDIFRNLNPMTPLRRLCDHVDECKAKERAKVKVVSARPPNWENQDEKNAPTCWAPVMNARFIECLRRMTQLEKNICMNTLRAIVLPKLEKLDSRLHARDTASWYESFLKGFRDSMRIVWIAKEGFEKPIVEAHFAGSRDACLHFRQVHLLPPACARTARKDMSGLENLSEKEKNGSKPRSLYTAEYPITSWPVKNTFQKALYVNQNLPDACVQLDPCQEIVACSRYPLLLESRSGTGKTLVLLQHAAYHSDPSDEKPACFVTVSPRLCQQLRQTYDDMLQVENDCLPRTLFFSYDILLRELTEIYEIDDFVGRDHCRFLGFAASRKSHKRISVEPHLVENEIGGVIMGSLEAAIMCRPLSRSEYLSTKRSNVAKDSKAGEELRSKIYDIYENYEEWKRLNHKYDTSDQVLRLLRWLHNQANPVEFFSSGYLDEVQDLSYAAIYLICSLAGRSSTQWCCAGDPVQMISPGCSFTFDGLKQVLLAIQPGLEPRLKSVKQLVINYRTTKDVLDLANAVLRIIQREFPGSIYFGQPETATKDLGTKVVLCDWSTAQAEKLTLGHNQALIYSCESNVDFEKKMKEWLGTHPFILSTLDSKGLEFDDVIVCFEMDRKVWNVNARLVPSLRMLRELYVAITRARRRVIILVRQDVTEMLSFFKSLGYPFQETDIKGILREFKVETSLENWREKGMELYRDEKFVFAARCFSNACDHAWSSWSEGRHLERDGKMIDALKAYEAAMLEFHDRKEFTEIIERAIWLEQRTSTWVERCNTVILGALKACPYHLKCRSDILKVSLRCSGWEMLSLNDLKERDNALILLQYRGHAELMSIVRTIPKCDIDSVERTLPEIIGDLYRDLMLYDEAVRLFLAASDLESAKHTTIKLLKLVRQENPSTGKTVKLLTNAVEHWLGIQFPNPLGDRRIDLLIILFQNAEAALRGPNGSEIVNHLGRIIVLVAVDYAKLDRTLLYDVNSSIFHNEVIDCLVKLFPTNQLEVVKWFLSKGDLTRAHNFAKGSMSKWDSCELVELVVLLYQSCEICWLFEKIKEKRIYTRSMERAVDCLTELIPSCAVPVAERSHDEQPASKDLSTWNFKSLKNLCIKLLLEAVTTEKQEAKDRILRHCRAKKGFKHVIKNVEKKGLRSIEQLVPGIVGDLYRDDHIYDEAVRMYLKGSELANAARTTVLLIEEVKRSCSLNGNTAVAERLLRAVALWQAKSLKAPPRDKRVDLLLRLFRSPKEELSGPNGERIVNDLGQNVTLLALENAKVDRAFLGEFAPSIHSMVD